MCLSLQTKNKILSKNRTPKKISEDEDKIEKQLGNLHNLSYVYILKINVNINLKSIVIHHKERNDISHTV